MNDRARSPRGHDGTDAGLATVAGIGLSLLLTGVAVVLAPVLVAASLGADAQGAADLAALAAAPHTWSGRDVACGHAAGVAAANGARLTTCSVGGSTVSVVVAIDVPGPSWVLSQVRGRARAGTEDPLIRPGR